MLIYPKKIYIIKLLPSQESTMFNFINNLFRTAEQTPVESSASSDEGGHRKEQEQKKEQKKYLEQEEPDEVKIGGRPELTEDEVMSMTYDYVNKLKDANEGNDKVISKLDKYLANFNVKKFMKNNPHMTYPDFYMVIFNETDPLTH